MSERLSTGIGPLVRGAVLLAQRVKLFRSHYRVARGYTNRRAAARIAWSWASLLKAPARGTVEPHLCRFFNGKCIDCGRSYGDRSASVKGREA